ncbi:hypothetical protein DI487_07830 [Flavobacterium sediminis]|uniref:Proline-specific endopeptidase n=1 Tax=Flavobacterium sediminis TaxID=2201181 RepID=A0A2U8QUM0_9FLAO|nr:prolyl oligopeptidase family serine peptidase [Flavobacterium sediminis]AWM13779.1 hypothetical protein DI487_07830 [Flavobacterium sediminis]
MRLLPLFSFFLLISFISRSQTSQKAPGEFSRFDYRYIDQYVWLEKNNDPEVKEWINQQNEKTQEVLEKAVKDNNFLFKIKDYQSLSTNTLPSKRGKYFYSNYRLDKDKPGVLHYRENLDDMPKELVDPYSVYKDNSVFISNYSPSKNSKYLAYQVSVDGSDRHEIRFVNIPKQEYLEDVLKDVKFSNLTWNFDEGIFYKKNANINKVAKDSTFQLFFHRIGEKQDQDQLILDTTDKESTFDYTRKGSKLFIIETNKEESLKNYYYINLSNSTDFTLVPFLKEDSNNFEFVNFKNDSIYYINNKYPWGSLSKFSIRNPSVQTTVIPQYYNHLLLDSYFTKDYIICKYKHEGNYYINVNDYNGKLIRKFEAPYSMNLNIRFFDSKTNELYVTFYSYTISYLNYKLNIDTGKSNVYYNSYIRPKPTLFPFDYFETKNITYKSRDNKNIPITIIYKKGIELNGQNPTLLEAYGGFGIISSPKYDVGLLHFLEKGGVYAYAEIRGGGDKGISWHKNGRKDKKMNTFNDFIDAAEFLISSGYTSSEKLAISGTSHGGLVVGVALTQRPELFKVAVPKVGAYDMLRFDEYTIGVRHLDEFGDPNVKEDFDYLKAYSPLHNIKDDVNYPITLIITSENDDRVPPIHSYKFAAKLQERQAQKNPVYLMVKEKAGHYGKIANYTDRVKQEAEFYSFIWETLTK